MRAQAKPRRLISGVHPDLAAVCHTVQRTSRPAGMGERGRAASSAGASSQEAHQSSQWGSLPQNEHLSSDTKTPQSAWLQSPKQTQEMQNHAPTYSLEAAFTIGRASNPFSLWWKLNFPTSLGCSKCQKCSHVCNSPVSGQGLLSSIFAPRSVRHQNAIPDPSSTFRPPW